MAAPSELTVAFSVAPLAVPLVNVVLLFMLFFILQSPFVMQPGITVNLPTAGVEYQLPFGGTKESSFGMREQGPAALDFYTETRTVYMKYA